MAAVYAATRDLSEFPSDDQFAVDVSRLTSVRWAATRTNYPPPR
jgi:hypothetical protein